MKLLSVAVARSTWLVDINELNPRGRNIFADLIPSLVSDFKFKKYPEEGGNFPDGMKFTNGEFVNKAGEPLVVNATLFNDGLVAETSASTKDTEEFLQEVLQSLPEFDFVYDPAMIRRKLYNSQIHVRCSKRLTALNPKLADFGARIAAALDGQTTFGFTGIEFWPDQTRALKFANFSFQKRVGDDFSDDRYWSQAPLPTDKHLDLLEELEALLS